MKPYAWVSLPENEIQILPFPDDGKTLVAGDGFYLYTHPAKPAICVGYWDNKTGAFHKHLTEIQQKRVDEGFLQPVYTAGMLKSHPVKEPIYRFDDEMLTELITTMDSVDAYMEAERRGFNDAKWKDIANGAWQDLMKLIYQAVNRIEENGEVYPAKELTDEEIKQIFVEESGFDVDTCPIAIMDFAKAILRKAQEK